MITLVELIRRSGREPGGGYPNGRVETRTVKWGKPGAKTKGVWLPNEPISIKSIAQRFNFGTPEIVDALHEPVLIFKCRKGRSRV